MRKDIIIILLFILASQTTDVFWLRLVYSVCIVICLAAMLKRMNRKRNEKIGVASEESEDGED